MRICPIYGLFLWFFDFGGTEEIKQVELTGADILVRCLADEGVEHVFGYPGGAVLHIYGPACAGAP